MHALRYRVSCNEIPERKKKKKKKSRLTIQIFKNNLLNFITARNVVKVDRRYLLNKKQDIHLYNDLSLWSFTDIGCLSSNKTRIQKKEERGKSGKE